MKGAELASSELWVMTTYFNFAGYHRRLANYQHFRQRVGAPLLTVELSAGREFALGAKDADILVQCAEGDVMWQKERLLNHGLSRLPSACRYVVWMDGDVLFERPDWIERVKEGLRETPLLQPFSQVLHAPPSGYVPGIDLASGGMEHPSVAGAVSEGTSFGACMGRVMQRGSAGAVSPGMAWAGRRELLEKHGWFDASIIGGGDTVLACAAFGHPEIAMELHHMNGWQQRAYLNWAKPFYQNVRGSVSHVPGRIIHLWHGEMQDRRPGQRHVGLREHDFNPARDITVGEGGAWRWASDKPALHIYLKDYFASRHEDGRRP